MVPTESNVSLFEKGDAQSLVGPELLERLKAADAVLVNLETPLSNYPAPIEKCGPNLIAPDAAVRGLVELNISVAGLANNHIMDQGEQGLASTIEALARNGIAHFGAGENLKKASLPYVIERNGITIGVYACVEHEFSIAGDSLSGANPFDPLFSFDAVSELKQRCDHVIVLYHGGKELYRYPSPVLQRICRHFIDKGASLVVCQHSHCVGCMEEWNGSTIVYGQGNFLFDLNNDDYWQTGLLLEIEVGKNGLEISYIPLRKQGAFVRAAVNKDKDEILSSFLHRSLEIQQPGFVESNYAQFAKDFYSTYLRAFVPGGRTLFYRAVNKFTGNRVSKALTKWIDRVAARNYLECESHRELFIEGLKQDAK